MTTDHDLEPTDWSGLDLDICQDAAVETVRDLLLADLALHPYQCSRSGASIPEIETALAVLARLQLGTWA